MGQDTQQLRREIEATRYDMSGTLDAIGDRLIPGRVMTRNKNRVRARMRSLSDRVMGTTEATGERMARTAHDAGDTVSHAAEQTMETIRDTPHMIVHRTVGAPLAVGAVAFGIGFVVAAAIPPSRTEMEKSGELMEKLEPVAEELKDDVVGSAKEVAEHLKEPARQAVESVKEAASDGAQAVTSTAKDAVQQTTEQAGDSVDAIRETARGGTSTA